MRKIKAKKAVIEKYGMGKLMSKREYMDFQEGQIINAFRGFSSPYPFSIPEMVKKVTE